MERRSHSPIDAVEADAAFECLIRFDHIVLAVSGGPDSMALLALICEWRARRGDDGPAISVATVDHGLRRESAAESEFVARASRRFGLSHTILDWHGDKPVSGLPDAARNARYRLLEAHARGFAGVVAVVTAHHQDDQSETFLMRLARGAGVDGLAAMRPERAIFEQSDVVLVRPLLTFAKSRLNASLRARDVDFVHDPTNDDASFERARVRQLTPALAALGVSADAVSTSARRIGDARSALDYAEDNFFASLEPTFGNEVFATVNRAAFDGGPALLRQRVLARLIARYGGETPAPQLSEIEDLAARLDRDGKASETLGGAMISAGPRFVRVWREAGRVDRGEFRLSPGEGLVWDRRFLVRWTPSAGPETATVRPLGVEAYLRIAHGLAADRRPPARAAYALPSFWSGGELLAVPSLAPFAIAAGPPFAALGCELSALWPAIRG